jgi:hypothetical protein
MALDQNALGLAISNRVKSMNSFSGSMTGPESAAMDNYWKAIADELVKHIKDHMQIALQDSDIHIKPGTFVDSLTAPVTGQGENLPITLPEGRVI